MALPKIEHPTFFITLPSNNIEIKIRPFTVKEEKLLLIANSSKDVKEIFNSIRQIIINCVMDEQFIVDDCAMIDIEYIFIQLRAKSINNVIEITIKDKEDEKDYNIQINLDDIKVDREKFKDNKIMLSNVAGVILTYPSYKNIKVLEKINKDVNEKTLAEITFKVYAGCIETIFDDNNVYTRKDFTEEEAINFINDLSLDAFKKIQEFFEDAPTLEYDVKYTNSLGNEKSVKLKGLSDFFI